MQGPYKSLDLQSHLEEKTLAQNTDINKIIYTSIIYNTHFILAKLLTRLTAL